MRLKIVCEAMFVLLVFTTSARADVFEFRITRDGNTWACSESTANFRQAAGAPQVNVLVTPAPADESVVVLKLALTMEDGKQVGGDLSAAGPAGKKQWSFTAPAGTAKATKATLTGTVETQNVSCSKGAEAAAGTPVPGRSSNLRGFDVAAADWLNGAEGRTALTDARRIVADNNPDVRPAEIRLLPHLPSGAIAPSYPSSISERNIAQTVLVVPLSDSVAVDWQLTKCETIPNYRVAGDFGGFQSADRTPRFKLILVGNTLGCGADKLEYTLKTSPEAAATPVSLTVRPIYTLSPLAAFGFETTRTSTFSVRDGKIEQTRDRVGSGLLLGGTYYIKGVDFADMRWYHHFANPFVAVSMAAPKERFVVGVTMTHRGGISAAIGLAMNHVTVAKPGFEAGQPFTGSGDVPVNKDWKPGVFIGFSVDDKLYASFKKMGGKGGTGGGEAAAAKPAAEKPAAEKPGAAKPEKK